MYNKAVTIFYNHESTGIGYKLKPRSNEDES